DRKSTRLNSSHLVISYAVFCLKKKNNAGSSRRYCYFTHLLPADENFKHKSMLSRIVYRYQTLSHSSTFPSIHILHNTLQYLISMILVIVNMKCYGKLLNFIR